MSMAAAKIAPPPPKRNGRLNVAPPKPVDAPDNLTKPSDDVLQDMNFKVKPAFHTSFKTEAVMRGLSMKELLEASFKCYLDTHGSKFPKR